jgi:putative spermidine/putrescine transport system permease protein
MRTINPYVLCSFLAATFVVCFALPVGMIFYTATTLEDSVGQVTHWPTIKNFQEVITDPFYRSIFYKTFLFATITTTVCAVIGTVEAWILFCISPRWRSACLLLILGPQLVAGVVRALGWTILFARNGLVNNGLLATGMIDEPLSILFTMPGVVIATIHVLVPYMVLTVWASLQSMDPATVSAARMLGASNLVVLARIVLPQAIPGIFSGIWIVFSLTAGSFVAPSIIGGRSFKVAATQVYDEFTVTLNWPIGSTVAVVLLVATLILMSVWKSINRKYYPVEIH